MWFKSSTVTHIFLHKVIHILWMNRLPGVLNRRVPTNGTFLASRTRHTLSKSAPRSTPGIATRM